MSSYALRNYKPSGRRGAACRLAVLWVLLGWMDRVGSSTSQFLLGPNNGCDTEVKTLQANDDGRALIGGITQSHDLIQIPEATTKMDSIRCLTNQVPFVRKIDFQNDVANFDPNGATVVFNHEVMDCVSGSCLYKTFSGILAAKLGNEDDTSPLMAAALVTSSSDFCFLRMNIDTKNVETLIFINLVVSQATFFTTGAENGPHFMFIQDYLSVSSPPPILYETRRDTDNDAILYSQHYSVNSDWSYSLSLLRFTSMFYSESPEILVLGGAGFDAELRPLVFVQSYNYEQANAFYFEDMTSSYQIDHMEQRVLTHPTNSEVYNRVHGLGSPRSGSDPYGLSLGSSHPHLLVLIAFQWQAMDPANVDQSYLCAMIQGLLIQLPDAQLFYRMPVLITFKNSQMQLFFAASTTQADLGKIGVGGSSHALIQSFLYKETEIWACYGLEFLKDTQQHGLAAVMETVVSMDATADESSTYAHIGLTCINPSLHCSLVGMGQTSDTASSRKVFYIVNADTEYFQHLSGYPYEDGIAGSIDSATLSAGKVTLQNKVPILVHFETQLGVRYTSSTFGPYFDPLVMMGTEYMEQDLFDPAVVAQDSKQSECAMTQISIADADGSALYMYRLIDSCPSTLTTSESLSSVFALTPSDANFLQNCFYIYKIETDNVEIMAEGGNSASLFVPCNDATRCYEFRLRLKMDLLIPANVVSHARANIYRINVGVTINQDTDQCPWSTDFITANPWMLYSDTSGASEVYKYTDAAGTQHSTTKTVSRGTSDQVIGVQVAPLSMTFVTNDYPLMTDGGGQYLELTPPADLADQVLTLVSLPSSLYLQLVSISSCSTTVSYTSSTFKVYQTTTEEQLRAQTVSCSFTYHIKNSIRDNGSYFNSITLSPTVIEQQFTVSAELVLNYIDPCLYAQPVLTETMKSSIFEQLGQSHTLNLQEYVDTNITGCSHIIQFSYSVQMVDEPNDAAWIESLAYLTDSTVHHDLTFGASRTKLKFTEQITITATNSAYNHQITRNVFVGCYDVAQLQAVSQTQHSYASVKYEEQGVLFSIELELDGPSAELDLFQLIRWESGITYCGADLIQLCQDSACNNLVTSGPVVLDSNPYLTNVKGVFPASPVLTVTTSSLVDTLVYIQAESQLNSISATSPIKIKVQKEEIEEIEETKAEILPYFMQLPTSLVVEVHEGEEDSDFVYTSNPGILGSYPDTKLVFRSEDDWLQATQLSQLVIKLVVKRSQIPKAKTSALTIVLQGDSASKKEWNSYTISIVIKFKKKQESTTLDHTAASNDITDKQEGTEDNTSAETASSTSSAVEYAPLAHNDDVGIIFPGVDEQVLEQLKMSASKDEREKVNIKPPRMKIGFNHQGTITMISDQPVIAPGADVSVNYDEIFEFEAVSAIDETRAIGTYMNSSRQLQDASDDEVASLAFNWKVVQHTPWLLEIQLKFQEESTISLTSFGYDKVICRVKKPELFMSPISLKPVEWSHTRKGMPYFTKNIPPFMDPVVAEQIETTVADSSETFRYLVTGNFFLSLLIQGALSQFYGMIRSMQLIILVCLVQITFPAPTLIFFQGCLIIQSMDIFHGELITSTLMSFKHTDPLNDNFDLFGIGTKNFMLNQGSIFLFFLLIFVDLAVSIFLHRVATRYYHIKFWREVGIKRYSESYAADLSHNLQKLFLESYFELLICTLLNLIAFGQCSSSAEFAEFFETPSDAFCSSCTIITAFLLTAYPVYSYIKIKHSFHDLKQRRKEPFFQVMLEGVKTQQLKQAQFNVYFMFRRVAIVSILIFLPHLPFFQSNFFFAINLMQMGYLLDCSPIQGRRAGRIELLNELTVTLVCYTLNIFLDTSLSPETRTFVGWFVIGVCSVSICTNLVFALLDTAFETVDQIKDAYESRKKQRRLNKKVKNRKLIAKFSPDIKEDHEELELNQDKEFFKEWAKHREWLMNNQLDLSEFSEEEKTFKAIQQKYKLKQMQKYQKYVRAIVQTADHLAREETFELRKKKKERQERIALRRYEEQMQEEPDTPAKPILQTINEEQEESDIESRASIGKHIKEMEQKFIDQRVMRPSQSISRPPKQVLKNLQSREGVPKEVQQAIREELEHLESELEESLSFEFDEEESSDELGQQMLQIAVQEGKEQATNETSNPGIKALINSGPEGNLQGLLQPLFELPSLRAALLNPTLSPAGPLSQSMQTVFQQVFSGITVLDTIDLQSFISANPSLLQNEKSQPTGNLFNSIINTINDELNPESLAGYVRQIKRQVLKGDFENRFKFYDLALEEDVFRDLCLLRYELKICSEKPRQHREFNLMREYALVVGGERTLDSCLKANFQTEKLLAFTRFCNCKGSDYNVKKKLIRVPAFLAIKVSSAQENFSFNEELSIEKYVDVIEREHVGSTDYSLLAVVSKTKKKFKTCVKKNGDWMVFYDGGFSTTTLNQVLQCKNIHILYYMQS